MILIKITSPNKGLINIRLSVLKGTKWWKKLDRHCFKDYELSFIEKLKSQTTSNDLLQIMESANLSRYNYFDKVIINEFPQLLSQNSIRVLFQKDSP